MWDSIPRTGDLGVAVQSKFFAVGSVVPWAKAGVGAIATQSYANVTYGPDGLELLAKGKSARETVETLTSADGNKQRRQLGIVDAKGNSTSFTGSGCHPWAGHIEKPDFCAQGNILTGKEVVDAMAASFEQSQKQAKGGLCDWLARRIDGRTGRRWRLARPAIGRPARGAKEGRLRWRQ